MVADKAFDLSIDSKKVYISDIPIKGKSFVRVFIDSVGEGGWSIIDESNYQIIDDSIVFNVAPTGAYLVMQVATTPVELTNTPNDATLILALKDDIKAVTWNIGQIVGVFDNLASIVNVESFKESIKDVATITGELNSIYSSLPAINNLNDISAELLNVNGFRAEIENVSNISSDIEVVSDGWVDVQRVSSGINNVNRVGNDLAILASSRIIKVSDNISNVIAVGNAIQYVIDVWEDLTNVNIVATNIGNVNNVGSKITYVNTVATNINNVNLVSNNMPDVNMVSSSLTDINTVAIIASDIQAVADISGASIVAVANNNTDISLVASTVVPNISEILQADNNAVIATTKATEAQASALLASQIASGALLGATALDLGLIADTAQYFPTDLGGI